MKSVDLNPPKWKAFATVLNSPSSPAFGVHLYWGYFLVKMLILI